MRTANARRCGLLIGLIESGLATRRRWRIWAGVIGLVVGTLAALSPLVGGSMAETYKVGAKNFSEQYILAELMASRLKAAGGRVTMKEDLGSATAYRAVASGEIDVYVDYSGTLWANVLHRKDNPGRAAVLAGLSKILKARDGVTVLGPLGFENAYVLVMRGDRAKALGVASLADLAGRSSTLKLGSDLEFLSRPEWAAIRDGYGLSFARQTSYQPTFMYRALADGEADVISAFSSDGRIAADHLVILADPKGALPPYDAVILLSPRAAKDARLRRALAPLIGAIPVEAMQAANFAVDRDANKLGPAQAARDLAQRVGLLASPH